MNQQTIGLKRKIKTWILVPFIGLTLVPVALHAQWDGFANDEHLRDGSIESRAVEQVPEVLSPDRVEESGTSSPSALKLMRLVKGVPTPVQGLSLSISSAKDQSVRPLLAKTDARGSVQLELCPPDSTSQSRTELQIEARLENQQFDIGNGSGTYRLQGVAKCGANTTWIFLEDSNSGQAVGIWQIAETARQKLEAEIGLGFWNAPIHLVWPDEGDFYNFGTVHLSRGDHWDVVGHEMGHAIYDLADLGRFGGGPHKIDQCYSDALALSEGWASYFSAWISVNRDDHDAKFEYMVPRRAPIRFENIPEDVCKGSTNEWRVTGFFWDLHDLAQDREGIQLSFKDLWTPLLNSKASGASSAARLLKQTGIDSAAIDLVWALNFGG